MAQVEIEPGDGVGAYIHGVDLARDLKDGVVADLRQALGDYGVLFFRDQNLAPEDHIAMAERFGTINVNRFFGQVDGYPQIAEVRKEPDQRSNIGGNWHTDHSYDQEPAMGSILVARELPNRGGDTVFANMYAAFDSLSPGLQETLSGLNAVHSSRHVFGDKSRYDKANSDLAGRLGNTEAAVQDSVHPVVIRHPISGRRALYVNRGFTIRFDGWTAEETQPLLDYLVRHATRPEHIHKFHWRPGSVAFWDNRATWHYAINDYHGQRRLMHRITVEGVALAA